jgi:hypothetical protein
MKVKDKNKLTTNFYITTSNYRIEEAKYKYHNIKPYAEKIINVYRSYLDEIKAVGFIGSDLDEDFLLWALIPTGLEEIYQHSLAYVLKKKKVSIDTPKRSDGSQHWVKAGFSGQTPDEGRFTDEEKDFAVKSNGNGIKTRCSGAEYSLQYDGHATIKAGIGWREFGSSDLKCIRRIASIVRSGEEPNDYDKEMIANYAKKGYAKMEDGEPKLLIPFLFADEHQKCMEIWKRVYADIGENLFADFIVGFAAHIEKEIPSFIGKDERTYLKYQAYPQYAVLYWLADNGLLRYPDDEEAKRLCTVVWCKE